VATPDDDDSPIVMAPIFGRVATDADGNRYDVSDAGPSKFVDADPSAVKTFDSRETYEAYCREHGLPVHPAVTPAADAPPEPPPA
jgi:hypothetical protein